jgi:hypothetical protein
VIPGLQRSCPISICPGIKFEGLKLDCDIITDQMPPLVGISQIRIGISLTVINVVLAPVVQYMYPKEFQMKEKLTSKEGVKVLYYFMGGTGVRSIACTKFLGFEEVGLGSPAIRAPQISMSSNTRIMIYLRSGICRYRYAAAALGSRRTTEARYISSLRFTDKSSHQYHPPTKSRQVS